MKFGDIGLGGRTRTRIFTDAENRPYEYCCVSAFVLLAFYALWAVEMSYHQDIGVLDEAYENSLNLPSTTVDHAFDNHLVFVRSAHPKLLGTPPSDPLLGFQAPPGVAAARRVAEYCQWVEHPHEVTEKIGEDSKGNARYKTTTTYTYIKGWESELISSWAFANSIAYHNPSRDPAPTRTLFAGGSKGANVDLSGGEAGANGLRMDVLDVGEALTAPVMLPLTKADAESLTKGTGFSEMDSKYLYSPASVSLVGSTLTTLAALFVDGVVDIGLTGKCTAGDVRVHFEGQSLPPDGFSAIAAQSEGKLVKHHYANGKDAFLITHGLVSKQQLRDQMYNTLCFWTYVWRSLLTLYFILPGWVLALYLRKWQDPTPFLIAACTVALYASAISVQWYVYYGLDDIHYVGPTALLALASIAYQLDVLPFVAHSEPAAEPAAVPKEKSI